MRKCPILMIYIGNHDSSIHLLSMLILYSRLGEATGYHWVKIGCTLHNKGQSETGKNKNNHYFPIWSVVVTPKCVKVPQ